jgi:hypothetical protein
MQLDAAARACDEAAHLAAMAPSKARAWAEQMVSGARVATPRTSSSRQNVASHDPASPSGGSRQPEPATASTDGPSPTAHRIIKKLPIRSSPRDKTRGMWIDESGQEHKLVSGYDQYRDRADQVARDWGITNPLAVTWHVEVKFAMQMRERGLCDATIYINNPVCDGPRSCDKLLPLFLKEGSSLTVHWPDAPPKTYTGKSKPA